MRDRFCPRHEAERLRREMLVRIQERVLAELAPHLVALMRDLRLEGEALDTAWAAAVNRVTGEELARAQAALEAIAVEGSA